MAVRSLLQCQPHLRGLAPKDLDALSFAFAVASHAPGERLAAEGAPAARLHLVLSGVVQLRRAKPPTAAANAAASAAASASAAAAADMPQAPCGEALPGDVIGAASVFGEASAERCSAIAGRDAVTLSIDRSAALSLLPTAVASALRDLADAARPPAGGAAASFGPKSLEIQHVLARGAFGTVALAVVRRRPTSPSSSSSSSGGGVGGGGGAAAPERFAVKKVRKDLVESPSLRKQILAERAALMAVSHACICRLHATHKTAIALYLVLELVDGPELFAVLQANGGLPEATARAYAGAVTAALGALHERGWVYRDLKAENLVLTTAGALKLVDLGLARRVPYGGRCFTNCGSYEYMAPEVVYGGRVGYDFAADWWGLGCLLFEMLYGHTPWTWSDALGAFDPGRTESEISQQILDPTRRPPLAAAAAATGAPPPTALCAALLEGLLTRNASCRLGGRSAGAADVRSHGFFAAQPAAEAIDWEALAAGTHPMPPLPQVDVARGGGSARTLAVDVAAPPPAAGGMEKGPAEAARAEEQRGGKGGKEEEEEEELDPISAQLIAFMKQRQAAEGAAGASSPPPSTTSLAPQPPPAGSAQPHESGGGGGASKPPAKVQQPGGGGGAPSLNAASADGFWDGPAWEAEGDAWDRDF